MDSITLDTCGLLCPMPLLRLGKAVRTAREESMPAARFRLMATDKKTLSDIPAYCEDHGLKLEALKTVDGVYHFQVHYSADDYLEPIT